MNQDAFGPITIHRDEHGLWADDGGNGYRLYTGYDSRFPINHNRNDLQSCPILSSTLAPEWGANNGEGEWGEVEWGCLEPEDIAQCEKAYEALLKAEQEADPLANNLAKIIARVTQQPASETRAYNVVADMALGMITDTDEKNAESLAHNLRFIAGEIESFAEMLEKNEIPEDDAQKIDLEKICEIIKEAGFQAYVEQTGGGTATIYAGTPNHHPTTKDIYYPLIAGPGWFDGPGWTKGRASLADFYYGPDTYGPDANDDAAIQITEGDEASIAATFIAYLEEHDNA